MFKKIGVGLATMESFAWLVREPAVSGDELDNHWPGERAMLHVEMLVGMEKPFHERKGEQS